MNLKDIDKARRNRPIHPIGSQELLKNFCTYHTVFPLRNIHFGNNLTNYDVIRQIIFDSIKQAGNTTAEEFNRCGAQLMDTLKWLVYRKWDGVEKESTSSTCPNCDEANVKLAYDTEIGKCPSCNSQFYITDWLGFHLGMATNSASEDVPTSYMTVHETLLLFNIIRHFWQNNRKILSNCLFIKDGPLSIHSYYAKLVKSIRSFLEYAKTNGHDIHIVGQEKSGKFYDYLQLMGGPYMKDIPERHYFIPDDNFIKEEINQRPRRPPYPPYGLATNYGAKIFVKYKHHSMIINIPTGEFITNPKYSDLIGANKIFDTLQYLLSYIHEGAIFPIELTNNIASISTYPSSHVLQSFAEIKK